MDTETYIARDCPVCGRSSKTAPCWASTNEWRMVRCEGCSTVFNPSVPAGLATGHWYDDRTTAYYLAPAKLAGDHAPHRYVRELKFFRRHCQGGRVLDVGCSTGAFLHQLQGRYPRAYEVVGIDVAAGALAHAEALGVPVVNGSLEKLEFGSRGFRAITFWAVLEHVMQPRLFLEKAAALLEPGGCCFVLVPNLRSLATRILGSRYRYIGGEHINCFDTRTLLRLAETEPSWQAVEIMTTHFNPIVIWQDWRRRGKSVSDVERLGLYTRTTRFKQSLWCKPLKLVYDFAETFLGTCGLADNVMLVLRKRS